MYVFRQKQLDFSDGTLSSGFFGAVRLACWKRASSKKLRQVAVRFVPKDVLDQEDVVSEVNSWTDLKHSNVVKTFGILFTNLSTGIVMQYVDKGESLFDMFEKKQRSWARDDEQMVNFCSDIAAGMSYLERKGVIHGDLSCRNVLVKKEKKDGYYAKVAGMGLSRLSEKYINYEEPVPFRWQPPEVVACRKFSAAGDVWSFGVTVHELYSFGAIPWGEDKTNAAIEMAIRRGDRLTPPKSVPAELRSLVLDCWKWSADKRPTFREIVDIIEDYVDAEDSSSESSSSSDGSVISKYTTDDE
ncbi:Tyrosine-protein kinase Tec [Halotydeus destructor]|nr:Tyrosine-protein kinase Tec [Halotydeus destructor]